MRFIVLGGGCYGSFYARQLWRAHEAAALHVDEIVVVDRNAAPRTLLALDEAADGDTAVPDSVLRHERADWNEYFDRYLATLPPQTDDQIVPSPFTPHLALAWLLRALPRARPGSSWRIEPFRRLPGTPYQKQAGNGTLTASHADWICPVHCIEPNVCPKTREARYWDMARTLNDFAEALSEGGQPIAAIHLLQCLHLSHGVGSYPASALLKAFSSISKTALRAERPTLFLVGTISRCHAAMHLLAGQLGTNTVSTTDGSFDSEHALTANARHE